jgi:nucleotide-binding universal stress UspA family protein
MGGEMLPTSRGSCPGQEPGRLWLRTVLVPVDGTRVAEHALPAALALAHRAGAEVTLVHVYSTLQAASDPELLGWRGGQYLVEPLRDYLDGLAERVAAAHPVRVRPLLLKGYWPADALCELADWDELVAADLIVMASRRRGWWSRLWRGSVSTEVACRSRSPVLLVPGRDEPPVLTDEPPLGRVLVPLDGSARAERALGPAAALAALTKGECDLLHVIRSHPYAVDWSLAYGGPPMGMPAGHEGEARRYLYGVAKRLRASSVPARWQVVADERPAADAIARYAELGQADVIAMTTRGGAGLAGLFRGSTAMRVARRADVPVLICRSEAMGLAA